MWPPGEYCGFAIALTSPTALEIKDHSSEQWKPADGLCSNEAWWLKLAGEEHNWEGVFVPK